MQVQLITIFMALSERGHSDVSICLCNVASNIFTRPLSLIVRRSTVQSAYKAFYQFIHYICTHNQILGLPWTWKNDPILPSIKELLCIHFVLSKFFLSFFSLLNHDTKESLFTDMKKFAAVFSKWEGSIHRIMCPIV